MTVHRDLIKSFFYKNAGIVDNYLLMKDLFNQPDIDKIDDWFKGVIGSLFYRPNQKLLVLCGKPATGKSLFLRELLPTQIRQTLFVETFELSDEIKYEKLIADCSFFNNKQSFMLLPKHDFRIGEVDTDKRLVSYATTIQEWKIPARKNVIVVNTDNFDLESFLKIDKMALWKQIYHNFK